MTGGRVGARECMGAVIWNTTDWEQVNGALARVWRKHRHR